MLNSLSKIFNRRFCFVLGVFFTFLTLPVINVFKEFLVGFEIQSMASFPYYHTARLFTHPGFGDQTFTLEVDERIVWVSGDAAPGNLNEKLIWDEAGRIVTLELAGKRVFSYDAELKSEIKE